MGIAPYGTCLCSSGHDREFANNCNRLGALYSIRWKLQIFANLRILVRTEQRLHSFAIVWAQCFWADENCKYLQSYIVKCAPTDVCNLLQSFGRNVFYPMEIAIICKLTHFSAHRATFAFFAIVWAQCFLADENCKYLQSYIVKCAPTEVCNYLQTFGRT